MKSVPPHSQLLINGTFQVGAPVLTMECKTKHHYVAISAVVQYRRFRYDTAMKTKKAAGTRLAPHLLQPQPIQPVIRAVPS